MVHRPAGFGAFQFVVLASLRAQQLTRGCLPRIEGIHKLIVTAQTEIAEGRVLQDLTPIAPLVPVVAPEA
jgi:DNA-directed RNA polymerase subunit K/omega